VRKSPRHQALCFPEPTLPAARGTGAHSGTLSLLGPVFPQLRGWSCCLPRARLPCKQMPSPSTALHQRRAGVGFTPTAGQRAATVSTQPAFLASSPLSLFQPYRGNSKIFPWYYNPSNTNPMLLPILPCSPFPFYCLQLQSKPSLLFHLQQRKISGSA